MRLLLFTCIVALLAAVSAPAAELPSKFEWLASPPVFQPGREGTFDAVAVKDPSIVRYDGAWRLFYTARSAKGYGLGYAAAPTLDGLNEAPRHYLRQLHGRESRYAAAPQVFYFTPGEIGRAHV